MKKTWKIRIAAGMLSVCLAASLMTGCGLSSGKNSSSQNSASGTDAFSETDPDTLKKTAEIEKIIDDRFYFKEDPEKREESYYDGIMAGLDDPYSVYYTADEYKKLQEDDGGEYEGIGATVTKNADTGQIYIVKPLRGSPAEKAGLQKNDVFVEVDGTEITTDMELEEVVKLIRGKKGTTAHLKMYREGEDDFLTFDVKRDAVQNITVDYEMLDGNIGYISIEQFIDNTASQFKEAVDTLTSQGATSLIFDLRNNPGGLLTSVIEMADYVIDDNATAEGAGSPGLLVETKDKNGKIMESYSCSDKHSVDLPMVVLANENSASAAEIFTGCLKDYKVATVIGTTTFGKGIVQQVIPLEDGSAIKITVAKYFTPSGADIHKKGIKPDIEVELKDELKNKNLSSVDKADDNQLARAIQELGGAPLKKESSASGTDAEKQENASGTDAGD